MADEKLTDFEQRVFARFVANHTPGYHDHALQLEGDKAIAVVRAGLRLEAKGLVRRNRSCHWYLTERGKQLAEISSEQNQQQTKERDTIIV